MFAWRIVNLSKSPRFRAASMTAARFFALSGLRRFENLPDAIRRDTTRKGSAKCTRARIIRRSFALAERVHMRTRPPLAIVSSLAIFDEKRWRFSISRSTKRFLLPARPSKTDKSLRRGPFSHFPPQLIPLFVICGAGCVGAAGYILRLATKNPDCS